MQNRSDTGGRENPFWLRRIEPGLLVGTRSADRIRASGQKPQQQAGHIAAPDQLAAPSQKPLPIRGRPHIAKSGHNGLQALKKAPG
jgi:hypothetical protein